MKKVAFFLPVAFSIFAGFASAEVKEGVEYKFIECSESYGTTFKANLMLENGFLYIVNEKSTSFEPTFKLAAQYLFIAREGYELGVEGAFTQIAPRGDTFTHQANYLSLFSLTESHGPQKMSTMSVGYSYDVEGEIKHSDVEYRNCTVNNKAMLFNYAPQR